MHSPLLWAGTDEFKVAADATDKNTQELAAAIGSVYGADAQTKFLALWRAHIGFFVDYAMAASAHDDAGKQKARANLDGYRNDIDAFLTGANPNLPKGAVAQLFAAHVNHLTTVIDDMVAGDTAGAYDMLYMAAHQTEEIMDPLSAAIAKQFPEKFSGDPMAPAASLRVGLNDLGAEHVYLAGLAFNSALSGRTDEFAIAAATTDKNTQALAAAIGSVYGADAQTKFLALWRAHIGFFVDYAMAASAHDDAGKQKARANLDGYRNDIDAFLTGANPNLPKGAVAQLFAAHVNHLTTVIDDMVAGDTAGAYDMLYMAAHQTEEIMDPLSAAIVKQFPDKFSGDPMAPAATLRVGLNDLGAEHVYLAGLAFNSALSGRTDEFAIAAATTDKNTQALAAAIGSVYGADAQTKFLALWRAHIGFFVDYAMAASAHDDAGKQKARANLDGYRNDIDAFLTGANPNLPKGAVAQLFAAHVNHLTTVIDDMVAGDTAGAYDMLYMAAHQTEEIMDPLSAAIAKQFPEKFSGDPMAPAASLRVGLNDLGAEHVYLAGLAFNSALSGRTDEFAIAAATTDKNTQALAAAIGSVYGADAQTKFLALWRAHIGFFVDYAMAASAHDDAGKQKARANLDGYRNDIDAFLTGANPNLPKGAVAQLFAAHVNHLTTVIDDMVAGDTAGAYDMLYMAAHQTEEIMDPLSAAIVKQFPDKFSGDPMAPAATLRVGLNDLGAEHVYLAGLAFNSALSGRTDEFAIAAATTDKNTQALAAAIGSVYGADAQTKFLALWRAHIGFFVDYAMAASAHDDAGKQKARANLDGYRNDIDAFLTGANPNLPKGAVAQLFAAHVNHLTTVIDDMVAGDTAGAYDMLYMAAHQTEEIMDPLSAAIVKQFPDKFSGDPMAPAATLRVGLNDLGAEHVYLAGLAFNSALSGRTDEFAIAAATTDKNTQALAAAIGSVYGADAQTKFLALWRAHIGFFVDYAMAASAHDDAGKQKARANLDGYRNDIDAFLTGANPNLPKGAVAQLFAAHVNHLTTVIDDMVAGDTAGAYDMLYMAAHQTEEIMDPLSAAIAKQFPEKFSGDPMAPAASLRVGLNDLGAEHVYLAGLAFNSALSGRTDEFAIAAATTDRNTQALAAAIGSVYGADAQTKFLALWRAHIGFFVDYAMAASAHDDAGKQKARANLDGYRNDIDAFLTGANPNLPKGAVAQLFAAHVNHLTTVIDDMVAGDTAGAYDMLYMAAHQTEEIMDPLSAAIAKQFPEKFSGDPMAPAASLRVGLNDLGAEHVYLAGLAFNSALSGRTDEFAIAAATTDRNTQALAAAIGSVYGADAQTKFLALWRAHIGFFVDYAMAASAHDDAGKQKARADL